MSQQPVSMATQSQSFKELKESSRRMDEIALSAEPLVIQIQVSAVCRTELTLIPLSSVAQGKRFSFFSGSHLGRGGLNHGCVSLTTTNPCPKCLRYRGREENPAKPRNKQNHTASRNSRNWSLFLSCCLRMRQLSTHGQKHI